MFIKRPRLDYGQGGMGAPPPPGPPPPGPMGPPPGGQGYPPMGPPGYCPPPQEKSSTWKVVLIGCGVFLLLSIVVGGGVCIMAASQMNEGLAEFKEAFNEGMGEAMDQAKIQYMNQLTGDHSEGERERFELALEGVYTDEQARLGLLVWMQTYQNAMTMLDQVAMDGQITVAESSSWCDAAEEALDQNDYYEDYEDYEDDEEDDDDYEEDDY